jgi:AcrR family transcriptional regulator
MYDLSHNSAETRERLIDAAGEVFAEHGFKGARVRDICARAEANVAAVNYHFRDKEGLYTTCLARWAQTALEKYPPLLGLAADAPAEQRLEAFVHSFLLRLLDNSRFAWHGKLMSREMFEPTGALDRMVEEMVRPLAQMLGGILRELLGPVAQDDGDLIRRSVFSVVGQCLFYHFAQPVVRRLHGLPEHYDAQDIKAISDHVTRFTLSAVRDLRRNVQDAGGAA